MSLTRVYKHLFLHKAGNVYTWKHRNTLDETTALNTIEVWERPRVKAKIIFPTLVLGEFKLVLFLFLFIFA